MARQPSWMGGSINPHSRARSVRYTQVPAPSSKKQGESSFSRDLKKNLHRIFSHSKWWKNHGTEYSEKGLSDLMGIINGRFYAIEVKIGNAWFTALQINFLRSVKQAGGMALGILKKDNTINIIPLEAMGHKGNHHRELWFEINYPDGLSILEYWER